MPAAQRTPPRPARPDPAAATAEDRRAGAGRVRPLAEESLRLSRELVGILRGAGDVVPSQADPRFADPAWDGHPGYRRLGQAYLAWGSSLDRLVARLESGGADWRDVERARFAVTALRSALAPTNTLLGNPAALKRAFDTGGASLLRGVRQMAGDVRRNAGLPTQNDPTAFAVGRDLACSRGAVVYRDDVVEVLQYAPTTTQVRGRPLVIVPPPIGRYYFLDLRPGRSFVEHAVAQGLQVFMVSWRNPTRKQAHWTLDTYAERVRRAIGVAREITGSSDVNALGFCAGGIILTTLLNHLAAIAEETVHSAAFGVTLLDFGSRAPIGAFSGRGLVGLARRMSQTRGIISARSMGSVFSWMRPDDLVFNYAVSQWLMGERPPAFDVLAWSADGTNLPAGLHEQFLRIFRENTLVQPGTETVLGTPVDLASITVPTFVTGALTDHLTPWEGCYRTTRLFSGPSTFVLSSSGHIQSLVNPPGNPKASYWVGGEPGADPADWREAATRQSGSWWECWAPWTVARSGDLVDAPDRLGSDQHPPQEPAPGLYVRDQVPAA
jgi:polyhydroxyalkanoate synthase